jgi:outer membrane biosynthesis protein TonB
MQVRPEEATAPAVAARPAPEEAAGVDQAEAAASEPSATGATAMSRSSGAPGSTLGGHSASAALGAVGEGAVGPAGVLGRGPALLALGNPCTGYFPEDAHADHGEVQLDVTVDASGHTHASAVLAEQPLGQGFASAARDCARRLEFAPAVSEHGAPMAGHARLKLRFKRRTS